MKWVWIGLCFFAIYAVIISPLLFAGKDLVANLIMLGVLSAFSAIALMIYNRPKG